MLPTLRPGDRLLVRHLGPAGPGPRVGRVAVVRLRPGGPGRSGRVVVAVKRVDLVDERGWWVTRDNPREGVDSWTLGGVPVPREDLVATAVLRLWPRPGRLGRPRRPGPAATTQDL